MRSGDTKEGVFCGELDQRHSTLLALRSMVREATVYGGSFAHWLGNPRSLSIDAREKEFTRAREGAGELCFTRLCSCAGAPPAVRGSERRGGERTWPLGYTGSLTYKGTVVLGAIALSSKIRSIGIDLELESEGSTRILGHAVVRGDLPPHGSLMRGVNAAFAVKEATFKAFFPLRFRRLRYGDVRVTWVQTSVYSAAAIARVLNDVDFSVRIEFRKPWIIAVALPCD